MTSKSDSKKYNWTHHRTMSDGHRLFMEDGEFEFRWAIADDSGETPDQTDDGVLWLDLTEPLRIDKGDDPREFFVIPLVDEDGIKTRTGTNVATLLFLARAFRWDIVDYNGRRHAIMRGGNTLR